jgi:hypothetical protein
MTQVEETRLDNSAVNNNLIHFSVYLRSHSAAQKAIMKQEQAKRRTKQTHTHKQVKKRSNVYRSDNNSFISATTLTIMQ